MKISQEGISARDALQQLRDNMAALHRGAKVLIVDDEIRDCELLARDLLAVKPSLKVDFALNKEEADRLCCGNKYDIIFLDLLFPSGSGVDILENSPCIHSGAHVIVLTGLEPDSIQVKEAVAAGANVIFTKPISKQQLNLIFGAIP